MKGNSRKRIRSFVVSIAMLMAGMTLGFILLGTVYTGPRWIAFIVFLVYLAVSYAVIRLSVRYIRQLRDENIDNPHLSS